MQDAVLDHLRTELSRAGNHVQTQLTELKHTLERVAGLMHWINRDVHLIEWCKRLIEEAEGKMALFVQAAPAEGGAS